MFKFADIVRVTGRSDLFVILGWDSGEFGGKGGYQIARLSHKTAARADDLKLVATYN